MRTIPFTFDLMVKLFMFFEGQGITGIRHSLTIFFYSQDAFALTLVGCVCPMDPDSMNAYALRTFIRIWELTPSWAGNCAGRVFPIRYSPSAIVK